MNRREALAAGGLAGVALGTGCVPRMVVPGGFDAASALADLDRSLAQNRFIASNLTRGPLTPAPGAPAELFQKAASHVSEICSEGARALMVASFFHGLTPDERLDPVIQTRMHEELPRIGNAVAAMVGEMERVGPKERRAIQKQLRESPGLEDRIASEVDGHASRSDAPFGRRVQLRRQMGEVGWRMRRQSADVVIDEIVGKFRKAEVYQRAHAAEIVALARPPGEAPPEGAAQPPDQAAPETKAPAPGESPPAATSATQAPATVGPPPPAMVPAPRAPDKITWWWAPGALTILIGLGTLGLGVVSGVVATSSGNLGLATLAVLVVSAAVVVLVVGLVLLLIGGLISASNPTTPKPRPAPAAPGAAPTPVPVPERSPDPTPL